MPWIAWLSLLLLYGCEGPRSEPEPFQVAEALGGTGGAGFARAFEPRLFRFPQDHGPHPEFRNEWWYFTGNLRTEDGKDFGFQVTLFRIALQSEPVDSPSAWRTNQVWMGHAALSDLSRGQHLAYERFARQGAGLAGADALPFRIWLEDWQITATQNPEQWQLKLPADDFDMSLELIPVSPVVLQGDAGLSQKSAEPGNASYYYSIPRLQVQGTLTRKNVSMHVTGLAWLDREWSTSALGPSQAGWDWFSLQLEDDRNLMYYQLRQKDGSIDLHSAGSLSNKQGLLRRLDSTQISLTPLKYWNSGHRRYPIEWRLALQGEAQPWIVRALLADQEMTLSVNYWEGAVEILDETSGNILGQGYLEMTGYD